MAITNGYATLAEAKAELRITDAADDTRLEDSIEAASRAIDNATGRAFYATTATKYYTPEFPDLLWVDDLLSVTTLKVDEDGDRTYERTWATTDYDLEPYNRTPYSKIRTTPNGRYAFPADLRKSVEIAGSWGYCATGSHPDDIKRACLLFAIRLFKRPDAPFGVLGGTELGFVRVPALDPDVKAVLASYIRDEIAAV